MVFYSHVLLLGQRYQSLPHGGNLFIQLPCQGTYKNVFKTTGSVHRKGLHLIRLLN